MKPTTTAKIIPGIVLAISIFFIVFWYTSSNRVGKVSERVPTKDDAIVTTRKPNGPSLGGPLPNAASGTQTSQPGATAVPAAIAEPPAIPGSWPRFRGANLDGICTETVPLSAKWAPGEPRIYWAIDLGEGHAGAAIYNSRVYILDYDQARQEDALRCLALADGKELWRYSYPVSLKRNHGMSRTVPAVTDKYVVTIGPKCQVVCANPKTGQMLWTKDLVQEYGTEVPAWYAGQCPLIDGDRAIIAPAGKVFMVAIDCATGRVIWNAPNPMEWKMTHSSIMPMVVNGKRTYVYCGSDGVAGVSADNGAILWQTEDWKVSIATVPTPVVIPGDRIFLCGGYNSGSVMLQISESGGKMTAKTLFRLKPSVFGSDQQTPIFYKGYIYGVIPGGQLVCLDLNGKQVWNSGRSRFGLGPYTIAGGKIYVMNDTGVLTLADATPTGYRQLSQSKILNGPDSWGPMAIAGGRLIARDLTRMVGLDIAKH
jgi:outer membrane protein assembly factor BamB